MCADANGGQYFYHKCCIPLSKVVFFVFFKLLLCNIKQYNDFFFKLCCKIKYLKIHCVSELKVSLHLQSLNWGKERQMDKISMEKVKNELNQDISNK